MARDRSRHVERVAAAVACTLLVLAALAATAVPAAAHPYVVDASLPDGAVLHPSPQTVSFTFGEDVDAPVGSIRVYDQGSNRVDLDDARVTGPDGRTVVAGLQPDLPDGAYVVIWRAIGLDDGHLVLGQQSFVVGHDEASTTAVAAVPDDDEVTAVLQSVATMVGTVGGLATAVAAGTAAFAILLVPRRDPRWRSARRRATTIVRTAAVAGGAAALALIVAEAAVRAALTGQPLDLLVVLDVVARPAGTLALARAFLLLPLVLGILLGRRGYVLGATGLAVVTLALDGHTDGLVTLGAVVHVATATLWAGGLVGLLVSLRAMPADDEVGGIRMLGRFSTTAAVLVVIAGAAGALVALGTAAPSLGPALATPWGELLRVKTLVAVSALLVAAHTRTTLLPTLRAEVRHVPAGGAVDMARLPSMVASAPPGLLATVRRNVTIEVVLVAVVLLTSGVVSSLDPTAPPAATGTSETPAPADDCPDQLGVGAHPSDVEFAHDCFPTLPDLRDRL